VTDDENRYAPIPWEDEYPEHMRGWIETNPLCTDIYATDKTIQERLDYFTSRQGFFVGEVQSWIQTKPKCKITQSPPNVVLMDALADLCGVDCDSVVIPCSAVLKNLKDSLDPDSVTPCTLSIDFTRAADVVYDFENVTRVWIHGQPYDPSKFTFSNPIVMTAHQLLTIKPEAAVLGEPIKFKMAFLSSALRNQNQMYMVTSTLRSSKAD
jgi:hypothetical protein